MAGGFREVPGACAVPQAVHERLYGMKFNLKGSLRRFIPTSLLVATRPARAWFHPQRRFDRRFNVDTSGLVELSELGTANDEASGYEASSPAAFARILKSFPLRHERFTFVDMGSGKGAVLLYASEFPFKQVIGVELSLQLHRIAEQNILTYRSRTVKCRKVQSIFMDATAFRIPSGPTVLFFGNPFKGEILRRVVENVERSLVAQPREIVVIYHHPMSRHEAWDHSNLLTLTQRLPTYSIYTPRFRS